MDEGTTVHSSSLTRPGALCRDLVLCQAGFVKESEYLGRNGLLPFPASGLEPESGHAELCHTEADKLLGLCPLCGGAQFQVNFAS